MKAERCLIIKPQKDGTFYASDAFICGEDEVKKLLETDKFASTLLLIGGVVYIVAYVEKCDDKNGISLFVCDSAKCEEGEIGIIYGPVAIFAAHFDAIRTETSIYDDSVNDEDITRICSCLNMLNGRMGFVASEFHAMGNFAW